MSVEVDERRVMARQLYEDDSLPIYRIAQRLRASRATIYKWKECDGWARTVMMRGQAEPEHSTWCAAARVACELHLRDLQRERGARQ